LPAPGSGRQAAPGKKEKRERHEEENTGVQHLGSRKEKRGRGAYDRAQR